MLLIYYGLKPVGLISLVATNDLSSPAEPAEHQIRCTLCSHEMGAAISTSQWHTAGAIMSQQPQLLLWKLFHHGPDPHPLQLKKYNDCYCSKLPVISTISKDYLTFKLWYLPCGAFRQSFMACVTSQGHSNSTASKQKAYLLTSCILIDDKIKAIHRID